MTEDDVRDLHKRIHEMSDAELEGLDPVCDAHAQFGRLDWHLVKKAMGPNWPAKWEALGPGEAIFDEEEDRT